MDQQLIPILSGLGLLVAGAAIGHTLAIRRAARFTQDLTQHLHKQYQEKLSAVTTCVVTSSYLISGVPDVGTFCTKLEEMAQAKFGMKLDLKIEPRNKS